MKRGNGSWCQLARLGWQAAWDRSRWGWPRKDWD